jgi:hypothetical protein
VHSSAIAPAKCDIEFGGLLPQPPALYKLVAKHGERGRQARVGCSAVLHVCARRPREPAEDALYLRRRVVSLTRLSIRSYATSTRSPRSLVTAFRWSERRMDTHVSSPMFSDLFATSIVKFLHASATSSSPVSSLGHDEDSVADSSTTTSALDAVRSAPIIVVLVKNFGCAVCSVQRFTC